MELPTCILVDPAVAWCREIHVAEDSTAIRLVMDVMAATAACPKCAQPSARIHSRYRRELADLPWANVPVSLDIRVRRFFCDNPECARRIFTERLPTIAAAWARRTQRLANTQQMVGLATGGSAGAALCQALGCPAGIDLLLHLVRALKLPEAPTPRVLGVDAWAKRKGQRYGTILIDHERGCVVELLADRAPETLAQWLQAHPGVEIVTRDRAEAYAQGIREGAPEALQVADRWHWLKNLTEAITKIFQDHQRAIRAQFRQVAPPAATASSTPVAEPGMKAAEIQAIPAPSAPAPPAGAAGSDLAEGTAADQRRRQQATEAHALRQQGWQLKALAQHLNCHPKTINRYLQRQMPLAPRSALRTTNLDAFKGYLLERWNAGCHNANQLFREIQQKGYDGRITIVRVHVASLRCVSGLAPYSRQPGGRFVSPEEVKRAPSCRQLAWLTAQSAEALDEADQHALVVVSQINATLKTTVDMAQRFAAMVCQRQPDGLDEWLDQATHSGVSALRSFANGLRNDYEAVRAALRLIWSNGRTEGHVNRLKCLKRQMYGRGGLDLLRRRVMAT
jgi:transposase